MGDTTARLTLLTRLGFAARGLLYLVVGLLVLTTGQAEDLNGAIRELGQDGGKLLLAVTTVGLFAYGLWRLADAAFNLQRHAGGRSGVAERVGGAVSGTIYLFMGWQAVRLLRGLGASGDGSPETYADTALRLPGGNVLVIAAGLVLLVAGLLQIVKGAKGTFLKHLPPSIASQPWALWTGRLGYIARGVVFAIAAAFLVQAGLTENAGEAGGMEDALAWLNDPWDIAVAAGLFAFGLFSLIEARFAVLHVEAATGIGQKMRARLG